MKIILCFVVVLAAAFAAAVPPNSYLARSARNRAALIEQVRTEPAVMDRYMRHFSMSEAEVLDYLGTLTLRPIGKGGVYRVFGVPRNGKIRWTSQKLSKNELVWFDAEGQPTLQAVCGNPMHLGPKRAIMSETLSSAPVTVPEDTVAMTTVPSTPVMVNPVMATSIPPTPVAIETTYLPEGEVAGSSSRGGGWFGALVPAAAVVGIITQRDSNDPVPEPATMLVLATGAAAVVAKRRKAAAKA